MSIQPFITRIAPSPTGYFHLGTARTAYFNWLAARASGGKFILRIDDTDASRNDAGFVDAIYRAMDYLQLDHDLSFAQSARFDRYRQVAAQMVASGVALIQDSAVFLNKPLSLDGPGPVGFDDITVGHVKLNAKDVDFISRMVLLKSDGSPTYHFASVVDDIDHGVNLVIRGSDHISNTMKQVAIYNALGAPLPQYAHVGLLHSMSGPKLSKRTGAPSLLDYQAQGVDPDAMCNFLLRLGWAPKVDDKSATLIPRDRALQLFLTGGNLRGASSKVDFARLDSLQRRYRARKDGATGR